MAIDPVSTDDRVNRDGRIRPDRSSPETALALPPATSVIVIMLSSLGLWASICWAIASLGSGWLW
jgi:hypothetical protein